MAEGYLRSMWSPRPVNWWPNELVEIIRRRSIYLCRQFDCEMRPTMVEVVGGFD